MRAQTLKSGIRPNRLLGGGHTPPSQQIRFRRREGVPPPRLQPIGSPSGSMNVSGSSGNAPSACTCPALARCRQAGSISRRGAHVAPEHHGEPRGSTDGPIALDELRVFGRRSETAKHHAAGGATSNRRVAVLTEVNAGHLLKRREHARELIAGFSGLPHSFIGTLREIGILRFRRDSVPVRLIDGQVRILLPANDLVIFDGHQQVARRPAHRPTRSPP